MPLMIDLKPGERIIINGAVLENASGNTKLRIHNESNILRQKEILTAEDAVTPAARVYYCVQCSYIFPEKREHFLGMYQNMLDDYVNACPSASELAAQLRAEMDGGHYYKGLKLARKLLQHEATVLNSYIDAHSGLLDQDGE